MTRKLYKIVINEDDMTGMDAISLVDMPAVQRNFVIGFSEDKKPIYHCFNEEKHIISGVVALADTPIYRYSPDMGEYYVVFERETIEKMVEKYAKQGLLNSVNLQHTDDSFQDGIYMIESFIKNSDKGIVPTAFADVPDGSWIVSYFVENDDLFDEIKNSGKLNGFSLQGLFQLEQTFSAKFENNEIKKYAELMKLNRIALRNLILRFNDVDTDKGVITVDGEVAVGSDVYVGEEKAENGEYVTEDVVIVVEDGKIVEVKEKEEKKTEEETEEKVEEEVEMSVERKAFEARKQMFEATYQEITENIYKAFNENGIYDCYIIENTNDYVIVEMWGEDNWKLYKYQISIGEDGNVSIGERKEVVVKYVEVGEEEEKVDDTKDVEIEQLRAQVADLQEKMKMSVEKLAEDKKETSVKKQSIYDFAKLRK